MPMLAEGLSALTWMLPSGVSIFTFFSSPFLPFSTLMEQPAIRIGRAQQRSEAATRFGMAKTPRQQDTPSEVGLFRKNHSGQRRKPREKRAMKHDERLYC